MRKHARVTLSREFQVGGGVQAFRAKLGGRFPRVGQARRGGGSKIARVRAGAVGRAVRGSAQKPKIAGTFLLQRYFTTFDST